MPQAQMYTQEQMDIALLKNTQEGITREIHGLGTDMNSLRTDMNSSSLGLRAELHAVSADMNSSSLGLRAELHAVSAELRTELRSMRDEIRSQGHWNIGLILGIYGMIGAAALGKIFGVL